MNAKIAEDARTGENLFRNFVPSHDLFKKRIQIRGKRF